MIIFKENTLEQAWAATLGYLNRLATDRAHPTKRYGSLASFNGREISQRTVVVRQVADDAQLLIYTDSRSDKVRSLRQYPQVSLLLYDEREQFQLSLKATSRIHHQDEVAHRQWQEIKGAGLKSYGSVLAPGTIIDDPAQAAQWLPAIHSDFFCVLSLRAYELEVVQLSQPMHLRVRFTKQGEAWQKQWMVP